MHWFKPFSLFNSSLNFLLQNLFIITVFSTNFFGFQLNSETKSINKIIIWLEIMKKEHNYRIFLDINEIPKEWVNILPFLPGKITPLLSPIDCKPITPDIAFSIFPKECAIQEFSEEPLIPIPKELREIYAKTYRPTPLHRALRLEKELNLNNDKIKIFYKNESVSPTGSHKPNTALAQAFYAQKDGVKELVTETGAGQWGSALSFGCNLFNIKCSVYMVRASYDQKPGRKVLMKAYGAKVFPSPSNLTETGKMFLTRDPNHPGSLGIAISEALEHSMRDQSIKYSLGSVVNFVCLHQTIIGQETILQLNKAGIDAPDILIACMGGGSNFTGFTLPFIKEKLNGKLSNLKIVGVEPRACPSVCKGEYRWDYGDSAKKAPVLKMHTLGHSFIPSPIHAGGLRYHGIAPIISNLFNHKIISVTMHHQTEVIKAGLIFAKTEGILPAPESAHAIKEAIDQALIAKENDEKKVIVFNLSGHGYFDISAFDEYLSGNLTDYELPSDEISKALNSPDMPKVDDIKL